jgi:hypothetical protein
MKTGEPEERRRGAEVIVPEGVRLDSEVEAEAGKSKGDEPGVRASDDRATEDRGKAAEESERELQKAQPEPMETLRPKVPSGVWPQAVALAKYMAGTEVHTYAFSVAANVILSLFPFIVLLLTIRRWRASLGT